MRSRARLQGGRCLCPDAGMHSELRRKAVWTRRVRWILRRLHAGRELYDSRSVRARERLHAQLRRQGLRWRWLRRDLRYLLTGAGLRLRRDDERLCHADRLRA